MKRLNVLVFLSALALSGLFLTSCEDTANDPPAITYDQTDPVVLAAGVTTTVITGTITAPAGLQEVKAMKVVGSAETQIGSTITSFDANPVITSDDEIYTFRFDVTNITENMSFKLMVTDKDNQTASLAIAIQTAAEGEISSWSATIGGGGSATGSFFASASGTVYSSSNAVANAANIDIIFYYGTAAGSSGAGLYAPNSGIKDVYSAGGGKISSTFSVLNATKFASSTVTAAQFDAATADGIITANVSAPTADMIQIAAGNVYGFTTVGGKKGLIKVVSVPADNNGTCSIAVKVQK